MGSEDFQTLHGMETKLDALYAPTSSLRGCIIFEGLQMICPPNPLWRDIAARSGPNLSPSLCLCLCLSLSLSLSLSFFLPSLWLNNARYHCSFFPFLLLHNARFCFESAHLISGQRWTLWATVSPTYSGSRLHRCTSLVDAPARAARSSGGQRCGSSCPHLGTHQTCLKSKGIYQI